MPELESSIESFWASIMTKQRIYIICGICVYSESWWILQNRLILARMAACLNWARLNMVQLFNWCRALRPKTLTVNYCNDTCTCHANEFWSCQLFLRVCVLWGNFNVAQLRWSRTSISSRVQDSQELRSEVRKEKVSFWDIYLLYFVIVIDINFTYSIACGSIDDSRWEACKMN